MPRTRLWEWPLKPERLGHTDRHAFMRAIPFHVLEDERTRTAGDHPRPARQGQALSVNISPGGMLLMMEGEPTLHDRLMIRLPQGSLRGACPSVAEVCWTRSVPALLQGDVFFVGVKFLNTDSVYGKGAESDSR